MKKSLAALAILSLLGCSNEVSVDKAESESPLPEEGAADSHLRPTDHGALRFGIPVFEDLENGARFHAWTFTLTGDARISAITTPASDGGPEVDTVLYLYRQRERGWGSWIARNDDADGLWSAVEKDLGAGTYRVLVKGYSSRTNGPFGVTVGCEGDGCGVVREAECVFGERRSDLVATERFTFGGERTLRGTDALDDVTRAQIVRAVRASAHDDVTSAAEAFERVDEGVINKRRLHDNIGVRDFDEYEYGAGDNSYGAIFYAGTTTVAAEIHDGDFASCVAPIQTCVFGPLFNDWTEEPANESILSTAWNRENAALVQPFEQAQILAAARVGNPSINTLDAAFATFDEGVVRRADFRHQPTDRTFSSLEYTRGDHRFGLIFDFGTERVVATIFDSEHRDCVAFTTQSTGESCRAGDDCESGRCETNSAGARVCE